MTDPSRPTTTPPPRDARPTRDERPHRQRELDPDAPGSDVDDTTSPEVNEPNEPA